MNDEGENADFLRTEVYTPQRVPTEIRRPNNLTPGQRYEIRSEEESSLASDSPLWLYCKLQYRVKDDIGRIICVPACFFEHPADKPLLHEAGDHDERLQRDNFDLRGTLAELINEGSAQYTEDITFHDFGINAQRMTPTQAKAEWIRILKIAGIHEFYLGNSASEFRKIEKAAKNMGSILSTLNQAIEKAGTSMFGDDKNGK